MFLSLEPRTAARVVNDVEFWDEEFYAREVQPVVEYMIEKRWGPLDCKNFSDELETYQPRPVEDED